MVLADSDRISRVPPYSGVISLHVSHFRYGALTLSRSPSHVILLILMSSLLDDPTTPDPKSVWALSLSLAATQKIILIFSSCRYLDVSVPCVSPHHVYVFDM